MARKLLDDLQLPGTLCDQDGCIEALYHLLWARNINGEACLDLLVPDVVIYKHITLCRNQLAQPSASWCPEGFFGRSNSRPRTPRLRVGPASVTASVTASAKSEPDDMLMHMPHCSRPRYRIPAYWYFTGVDGQLKRKHKGSIVNKKIFAEFTKGAKSAHEAVAYHITQNEDGTTAIQYLDTQALREFLFNSDKVICAKGGARVSPNPTP